MLKLLVASQQGGVGKTTTAVNLAAATALAGTPVLLLDADPLSNVSASLRLAEHPGRHQLRSLDAALPGLLVCDVLPKLNVLCPYDDGGCSDRELSRLLRVVARPELENQFGCLVVNTPPFLGANPGALLALCDEFIVLMRAEPMAYRTLPAFLELVQRSRVAGPGIKMRGILLSLPDGEAPGGRCERELRGRLGTRILPEVIPFDPEVERAQCAGTIASASAPTAPAPAQYHRLVQSLALARDGGHTATDASLTSALVAAAAAVAAEAQTSELLKPACPDGRPGAAPADSATDTPPPLPRPRRRSSTAVPIPAALRHRVLTPLYTRPIASDSPPISAEQTALPPVAPSKASRAVKPPPAPPVDGRSFSQQWALLWVGLAILLGVALRFLRVPEWVLPLLAGVAAAAVSVVVLRQFAMRDESQQSAPASPDPQGKPGRPGRLSRTVRRKPTASGSEN